MIDYLIVGSGLAGISFAETAIQQNKTVYVFDNQSQKSSRVAAGIYNPVILKRFSEVWQAQSQLQLMEGFYSKIETKLNTQLDYKMPVYRKFFSVEEQNNWFQAADKPKLAPFLSTQLAVEQYQYIDAPFYFGEVLQTGFVDTQKLIVDYQKYLLKKSCFSSEKFDYQLLNIHSDAVSYQGITARRIIFAEGFGLHQNPFFNHLPLDGTKGEVLVIKAPKLKLDKILNASVYFVPLGNDLFKIGATYHWDDKSNKTTAAGKNELIDKIKEIISCEFEIISHLAGVRPTVKDRKPLVGTHTKYANIHVLNGMGTRGVMLAPTMAKLLYDHIEIQVEIPREVNINRFLTKQ